MARKKTRRTRRSSGLGGYTVRVTEPSGSHTFFTNSFNKAKHEACSTRGRAAVYRTTKSGRSTPIRVVCRPKKGR